MSFNPNAKHIIVNYHYVDIPRDDRRGFHPCSVGEFEKQVAFLSHNYRITRIEELYNAAKENIDEKLCALTFDDGLKDNINNAVPLLDAHGVTGTFFPITKTTEGFLPTTHKMHYLLSLMDAEEIADRYNAFLSAAYPHVVEAFRVPKDARLSKTRKLYDDIVTANIKEIMNRVPHSVRNAFLASLFENLGLNEEEMTHALFMDLNDVKKLHETGHTIGSHGHTHEALDALPESDVREEIALSKELLEKVIGEPITILSYPQSAPSVPVHNVLKTMGFSHALTTERKHVEGDENPYLIPRYDSNDVRDHLLGDKSEI
jgi:peptidoglycan/xylan/chitin deacetylase (PgdA/CDA1 family)